MKISLLFPILLILSISSCKKPTEALNESAWNEYRSPSISKAYLRDSIPQKLLTELSAKEINGVKVSYKSGKSTRYYEYEADGNNLLSVITRLPFRLKTHALIDTTYRAMNIPFSLSGKEVLSEEEITATSFFWKINPAEFDYYECLKDSDRHTVLINKKTKQILHRIESV